MKCPLTSALHITHELYENILPGLKCNKKEGEDEEAKPEEENEEGDDAPNKLREKIERQLLESEEFLKSLNVKAKEEKLWKSNQPLECYAPSETFSVVDHYPYGCRKKLNNNLNNMNNNNNNNNNTAVVAMT